jgi:hypothetical protein
MRRASLLVKNSTRLCQLCVGKRAFRVELCGFLLVIPRANNWGSCDSPNCIHFCIRAMYLDTWQLLLLPAMIINRSRTQACLAGEARLRECSRHSRYRRIQPKAGCRSLAIRSAGQTNAGADREVYVGERMLIVACTRALRVMPENKDSA